MRRKHLDEGQTPKDSNVLEANLRSRLQLDESGEEKSKESEAPANAMNHATSEN